MFARTINLIPWAIPTIVAGYAFRWLLDDQFGLLAFWVTELTALRPAIFINPLASQIAVILVHVWKDAPFMAIILLAACRAFQRIFAMLPASTVQTPGSVSGG
jgi:ABC-type sugar transport system permease subunit